MAEAVTPPNPANNNRETKPDPTLLTIDSIRREIAMLTAASESDVEALEKLMDEKFQSVDALMDRAEELRREQKADTAAAVSQALESQKEATTKMEKSISDQIASLRGNFETEMQSIRGSIGDLKDRMTVIESIKQGAVEQKTETRQVNAGLYAAIGVGTTILLVALTIAAFFVGGG